jgi:hypothetical protein
MARCSEAGSAAPCSAFDRAREKRCAAFNLEVLAERFGYSRRFITKSRVARFSWLLETPVTTPEVNAGSDGYVISQDRG